MSLKLSEFEYSMLTQKAKSPYERKNKYNAQKVGGCDSKKEYKRLQELKLLLDNDQISYLIPHVTYTLIGRQQTPSGRFEKALKYTCDAQYIENGKLVVEDTKSEATRKRRDYIMARKLMLEKYGIEIREV